MDDSLHHFKSLTLVERKPFHWRRDANGTVVIRKKLHGPKTAMFTADQYAAVIGLISSCSEGTRLGALAERDMPSDSFGRLLSSFGMPRSYASYVAAVAVEEGYADHEYRGRRNGGLWLFPAEEGTHSDEHAASSAPASVPDTGSDAMLDVHRTASRLRELADRIESASLAEAVDWRIDLADAISAARDGTLASIAAWEREIDGAHYLYRLDADDRAMMTRCIDALSAAKARNVGGRRFSRVNGGDGSSRCLYVGSSRRLATRVHQHLGLACAGTHALQIAYWRPVEPLTIRLRLRVFRLPAGVDGDVVQALRNELWRSARPAFGRPGSR